MPERQRELVVLLHGLFMPCLSLWLIGRLLRRSGYRTLGLGYPSWRHSLDRLAERVDRELHRHRGPDCDRVHFVTHSMGALVLRLLLEGPVPPERLGRVVMLAPPSRGSFVADWLARFRPLRWILRHPLRELSRAGVARRFGDRPVKFELGVIAGSRPRHPLWWWLAPPDSDGLVRVEDTKMPGMRDFLVLPLSHDGLLLSGEVGRQAAHFLAHGRFDRGLTDIDKHLQ